MAELRHRFSRPALRQRWKAPPPRSRNSAAQRRAGARQRRAKRADSSRPAPALQSARREIAARPARPRRSRALPQHLDPRTEDRRVISLGGKSLAASATQRIGAEDYFRFADQPGVIAGGP